jgi:tetratricopeptide (TPR) repeat protein
VPANNPDELQRSSADLSEVEALLHEAFAQVDALAFDKARRSLRAAERLAAGVTSPSRDWWAGSCEQRAYVLDATGDYEGAVRQWQAALNIYRPHPANRSYTRALMWMIESLRSWGAIEAARDRAGILLAWSPRLPQGTRMTVERSLAMCEAMVGEVEQAVRRLERLAAADLPTQPTRDRAGVCYCLGGLEASLGSHELAVQWYRRALTIGGSEDQADRARIWISLVACLHDAGRNDEAAMTLCDARGAVEGAGSPTFRLHLDLAEAFQLLADGSSADARSLAHRVIERADDLDGREWRALQVRAHTLLARIAKSTNDYGVAVEHLKAADQIEDDLSAFPHRRLRILAALADAHDQLARRTEARHARDTAEEWPAVIRERSEALSASVSPEKLRRPRTPLHSHIDVAVAAGIVGAVAAGAAIALR